MTERDEGGPAFPTSADNGHSENQDGMSLRDYFAAKAMHAIMCTPKPTFGHISSESLAEMAYQQADAMLKARQG